MTAPRTRPILIVDDDPDAVALTKHALAKAGIKTQIDVMQDGAHAISYLKEKLALTDGNLGAHLRALEDAGYIAVEKTFVERRPKTFVAASASGRKAFAAHVAALQAILKAK